LFDEDKKKDNRVLVCRDFPYRERATKGERFGYHLLRFTRNWFGTWL